MQETSIDTSRLGIHYFADSDHYSPADQARWLPILRQLGVEWIVLRGPAGVAIPQRFIEALVAAGIQPIVHLPLSLENPPAASELAAILRAYATWGVRQVAFFDRPNQRTSWPSVGWTQRGLVERFIEVFTPLAQAAVAAGLQPLFPPLEPGGDYWDTAFLRASLEELAARQEDQLLERLGLSAYAWTEDRPLEWGAGGPERWPATLPYITPDDSQDQRGFRIFDWYNTISRAVLGRQLDTIILAAGEHAGANSEIHNFDLANQIGQAMNTPQSDIQAVPANVLACNFWLLSAAAPHGQGWYENDGSPRPLAENWLGGSPAASLAAVESTPSRAHHVPDQAPAAEAPQVKASTRALPYKGTYDYLSKDGKMFDQTLMTQLKELAAAGVEVHVNVNAGGFSHGAGDDSMDDSIDDGEVDDSGTGDEDKYANYRKVYIPQEKNYQTAIFEQDDQGLASDTIASRLYHNDVVEILDESGPNWRLVRIADLGDFGERGEGIPGAIGWLRVIEGIELQPLA